jgi:hypothetical protein
LDPICKVENIDIINKYTKGRVLISILDFIITLMLGFTVIVIRLMHGCTHGMSAGD